MADALAQPMPAGSAGRAEKILEIRGIAKSYGATVAVRRVSFDIDPGEIHALLGENGAGKSTIVKVLSGIVAPDTGSLTLDGRAYAPADPMAARAAGVSTAFQELSLLPNLSVAENLMLPRQAKGVAGLVSVAQSRERAAAMLAAYGLSHIHPGVPVQSLSLAEKQRVEIMRAVARKPRLLVLDEPTAALADPQWLFDILERLTAAGTGVLYISHRLSEVRRLCRRGTVLRNGESIETVSLAGIADAGIFEMMVGATARGTHAARSTPKTSLPEAFGVRHLAGGTVEDITLSVGKGEIVGVAGLEGQGQRDLFRMLAGLTPARSGEIRVDGKRVRLSSPAAAAQAGIGFVPEERKTEGVFLGLRTDTNMTLPVLGRLARFGVIDRAREKTAVDSEAGRVDLASRYLKLRIGALSGGNQQKALIGRVLMSGARYLVLFDPTRGVDVGTKAVIYDVIRQFVAQGGAALVYSTELAELIHLVDRCVVVYGGRVAGEAAGQHLSEARLVALAAGHGANTR
ncbi:sugar ABC transporter ATP-binding protein [Paraburkholderia rhizosphaerae]|uniref:Ribose transport system ATP-binding protein n=1 Tax=Paraburkholderia rhizosphaerae TaxID=480658 RepID=A0A4R8LUS9_9BURK|nr:sugar ABC transporter ATP-binding protein [Paraburkholderia rhizosphaerae]TDY50892.1 ribose transport system ATP-binding protein [Paraburkholderia rhizosphaerae]